MTKSIKKIAIVTGLFLGAFAVSALADFPAPANPPSNNIPAPINVGIAGQNSSQTKYDSLSILGNLAVKGFEFLPGAAGTVTKGSFLVAKNSDGAAEWKKPIFCSKENFLGGPINSEHYIYFTSGDCGNTLPDGSYIGVLSQIQVCHGFQTVRVFTPMGSGAQPTLPGIYFWGNAPTETMTYGDGCLNPIINPLNGVTPGKMGTFSALFLPFN